MNKIFFNLLILCILLFSNNPSANELLLYADNISYDSNIRMNAWNDRYYEPGPSRYYSIGLEF